MKPSDTDKVQLNLVQTDYKPDSTLKFSEPDQWPAVARLFLFPKKLKDDTSFCFRVVCFIAMVSLSVPIFFKEDKAWVVEFLHSINLLVHEAGHVVFRIFGNAVITSLGGSLFQCMVPLIFFFALWIKPRDLFGAAIALWWSFENVMDVVPYVADALPMRLLLINGVTGAESPYGGHDWNFILSETGHLLQYLKIAHALSVFARIGIALCIVWAAWSLLFYWFVQRSAVKNQIHN